MRKLVNMEAIRNVFTKVWKVSTCLSIREVGKRIFIFRIRNNLEKERVIQKWSWSFNKSLLVLRDLMVCQSLRMLIWTGVHFRCKFMASF